MVRFVVRAALLCIFWSGSPAPSQAQVIVGNCNVVVQGVRVGDQRITVGDLGCPQDPRKTLRITYYWLDATSASFLLAGAIDQRLTRLLGASPIIIQNATFRELNRIIDRFGVMREIAAEGDAYGGYFHVGLGKFSDKSPAPLKLPSSKRSVRVYEGESIIYYPDFEALKTAYSTLAWPRNYSAYYIDVTERNPEPGRRHDWIFNSTVHWRHLPRTALERYADLIEEAKPKLQEAPKLAYRPLGVDLEEPSEQELERIGKLEGESYERERARLEIAKLSALARNRAVAAMLELGRERWPADFLQAYGFMEQHAYDSSGWSIVVLPRRLYVQIAVIENIGGSGATYRLTGFSMSKSKRTDLRTAAEDQEQTSEFQPFVPGVIGKGDRVVIPLAIELRTRRAVGREDVPQSIAPSNAAAQTVLSALQRLPSDRPIGAAGLRKQVSAFARPVTPNQAAYFYGPRFRISEMHVETAKIALRQYDPTNVFMVAGFEGGSCPVLYVLKHGHTEPYKVGTILRAAKGRNAAQWQEINLGTDVKAILISEEEPERATIEQLAVDHVVSDGTRREILSAANPIRIDFGESFRLGLPNIKQNGTFVLRVKGYYETYTELHSEVGATAIDRAARRTD
jgi:hypothetical protein